MRFSQTIVLILIVFFRFRIISVFISIWLFLSVSLPYLPYLGLFRFRTFPYLR